MTRDQLARGERLVEILKQPQYSRSGQRSSPHHLRRHERLRGRHRSFRSVRYEEELYAFVESRRPSLLPAIAGKRQIDDELRGQMVEALEEFGREFAARKAA